MSHRPSLIPVSPILSAAIIGLLPAMRTLGEDILIGGAIMNGNFNAPGAADSTYAQTPYLINIGTSDPYQVCIKIDETRDGSPNALIFEGAGRVTALDTGYSIQEGDKFSIRYWWKDSFNWNDALDRVRVRLFVTDNNTPTGVRTNLVSALSATSTSNNSYEMVDQDDIYTATALDAGRTLFVELDAQDGNANANGFARMDDFELTVLSRFSAIPTLLSDNMLRLSWNSMPGRYYTIQRSDNLRDWDVVRAHLPAEAFNEQLDVSTGGSRGFYRVIREAKGPMVDPATPAGIMPTIDIPDSGGWVLDFSDEFNGAAVDAGKWNITVSSSSRTPRPSQGISDWFWKPENVSVSDGCLVLDVIKHDGNTMHCGSIDSDNKYEPTYGFFEARIEIADTTKSTHTAFWLQGDNQGNIDGTGNDGAEIDIFESAWFDDYTKSVVHIDGYGANHQANTMLYSTPGLHSDFHVFGMEWTADRLRIYYDGVPMVSYSGIWVPQVAEFLWLSVGASFGDVGTFTSEANGWLSRARVDYVRVWKKP